MNPTSRPATPGLWRFHLMALVTQILWSTTFVSTKLLLQAGLSPEAIFFYRFLLAYVLILFVARRKLFADTLADELLLMGAGLTGGSVYFLTENTALGLTYASNVSILITTTPLFTMAIGAAVFGTRLKWSMLGGALLALGGVVLVVANGEGRLRMGQTGDLLTIAAAISWAVYSIILKYVGKRGYSIFFISRKVFFYGLASMLLYLPFSGESLHTELLSEPVVAGNLLFLGVVCSFACFIAFNRVVEGIGPAKATNYIYLSPVGTMTAAAIVLHEPVSLMAVAGTAVIIAGVVIAEKY